MIVNMTADPATPEQLAAGVFDPTPEERAEIVALLTFDTLPEQDDIERRADDLALTALALLAARFRSLSHMEQERLLERDSLSYFAMVGGASFLMPHLEQEMVAYGVNPLYPFLTKEGVHRGFVAPTLGAGVIE